MRVLILGGTTEATELGRAIARDGRAVGEISLAGRTLRPLPQPLPTRTGGFGGAEGLAHYLAENRIDVLIDATHPFAARMTANAVAAARVTGTKLLVVLRPAWQPKDGDRWTMVANMSAAASAIGTAPRRVLLTVGQKDILPFAAVPQHHYVLRSVDPPPADVLPPDVEVISARGPFAEADEHRLLVTHRIDVIVTKNSGGSATEAKLAAARALGLPVVMVERPPAPPVETAASVADVLAWLERRHAAAPRGE
jgi:precorrin-6A/cobalt-precorrin-6A reductase